MTLSSQREVLTTSSVVMIDKYFHRAPAIYGATNTFGTSGNESACNAGEPGSIPGVGRYPGEGNDNPLQYSCLENSVDRGA